MNEAETKSWKDALKAMEEIPEERDETAWGFIFHLARMIRDSKEDLDLEVVLDIIHDAAKTVS